MKPDAARQAMEVIDYLAEVTKITSEALNHIRNTSTSVYAHFIATNALNDIAKKADDYLQQRGREAP